MTTEEEIQALEDELASKGLSVSGSYNNLLYGSEEEEEDTGFLSNVVRGGGERLTDIGGSLAGAAEDVREGLTEALGGDFRVGYNLRGEDSGFDAGFFTPEEIKEQGTLFNYIDEALTDVDLGYEERYTLERMKEDTSFSTVAGFGIETLGKSLADMAGMYASLPLYFTARENEMAEERAAADGRVDPTFQDYALVAPGNAVETLLDKFMFGKMTDTKAAKDVLEEAGLGGLTKEVVKRIGQESATEGLIQEPASYLATHVGTESGVDTGELSDVALGGAVGGATGGVVIGGPAAILKRKADRKAKQAADQAKADAIAAEAKAELDRMNQINADVLAMDADADAVIAAREQEAFQEEYAENKRNAPDLNPTQEGYATVKNYTTKKERAQRKEADTLIDQEVSALAEAEQAEVDATLFADQVGRAEEGIVAEDVESALADEQRDADIVGGLQSLREEEEFMTGFETAKNTDTLNAREDTFEGKVDEKKETKRKTQDAVNTSTANKTKRKQARAERILDNPKSTDEQVEQAEATLEEVAEESAVQQAKQTEQQLKRNEEDVQAAKESFLADVPTPNMVKKQNAASSRLTAESLGIPTKKDNGKNVPASTLKKAINEHPEVVAARAEQAKLIEEGAIDAPKTEKQKAKEAEADKAVSPKQTKKEAAAILNETIEVKEEVETAEQAAEAAKVEAEEDVRVAEEKAKKAEAEAKAIEDQIKADQAEAIKKEIASLDDRFAGWVEEDGTFFNDEGEMFTPHKRARAAYYKSVGKADPEAMTDEDKGGTELSKVNAAVNKLEWKEKSEDGLTAAEKKKKVTLLAKQKELRTGVVTEAKADTAAVETEDTTAPEGASEGAAGQEGVTAGTTTAIDEDVTDDIEVTESPKMTEDEWNLKKAEDAVTALKKKVKKPKAKKKAVVEHTAESLDQAVADGVISYPVARQMAETVTGMSQKEAAIWLAFDKKVDETSNLTDRQQEQLNGWVSAGVEADLLNYAEQNPEVLQDATDIKQEEDLKFVEAAQQAVRRHREASPEMSDSSWRKTPEETKQAVKDRLENKPKTTKKKILDKWKENWGTAFRSKVVVVDTFEDLPPSEQKRKADSDAMAWAVRGGKIYVVADRVPEGYEEGLILHEYGVHQALKESQEYSFVTSSMQKMLDNGNKEVEQAFRIARQNNPNASEDLIMEEAIAYLLSHNTRGSAFRTVVATMKRMVKGVLGLDMSTEDIITLVNSMVHDQAATEKGMTEADLAMKQAIEDSNVDVEEIDAAPAPEMGDFDPYTGAPISPAKRDQKRVQREPSKIDDEGNYQGRVTSTAEELEELTREKLNERSFSVTDYIKKGLAYVVSDPYLYDNLENKWGFESASELHSLSQKELAEAQVRTTRDMKELVEPAHDLGRQQGEEIMDVAHLSQVRKVDMKGTAEYEALSEEQQAVYDRMIQQGREQQADYIKVWTDMLKNEVNTDQQKKDLQNMIGKFEANENYVPFQRQGDYRFIATMPDGKKYVSRSDNREHLMKEAAEAERLGWTEGDVSFEPNRQNDAQYVMTAGDLELGKRIVDEQLGVGNEENKAAKAALWTIMTESARNTNLQNRTTKRKFIAGASRNLTANLLGSTGLHNEIMKLQYAPERAKLLSNLVKQQESMPTSSREEIQDKLDAGISVAEAQERFRDWNSSEPRAKWSKWATKASYILHLAMSGGTALINVTQPHMIGIPYLAKDYGVTKSAAAILKAQADVRIGFTKEEWLHSRLEKSDLGPDEVRMLKAAHLKIANTEAGMLTDMHDTTTSAEYGINRMVSKTMGFLQHRTEVSNRQATALAAYRLARDAGKGHVQAQDEALTSINKVNFDFSESGKSRWQRGDIGSVMSNFKSHPIKMAEMQARAFKKISGRWKVSPEERSEAIYTFSGLQIMNFAYAGSLGMPVAGVIGALYQIFGGDEEDFEEFMDKSLESVGVSDRINFAARRGVIPAILGIDIADRVGLGGSLFRMPRDATNPSDWIEAVANTGGPITARLGKVPDAAKMINEGNYFDAYSALVEPAFMKNARKSYTYLRDDRVSDRFGNTYQEGFDEVEALKQSIGLSPWGKREAARDFYREKTATNKIKMKRSRLLGDLSYATVRGTPEDRREARAAIREWNRSNRDDKISQSQMKTSIKRYRQDWR